MTIFPNSVGSGIISPGQRVLTNINIAFNAFFGLEIPIFSSLSNRYICTIELGTGTSVSDFVVYQDFQNYQARRVMRNTVGSSGSTRRVLIYWSERLVGFEGKPWNISVP